MRNSLLTLLAALGLLLAGLPAASAQKKVSPTRYDYTQVAQQLTQGCATDYDRAKAIYRWLCATISYDTSHTIYTADECWDKRAGVCQAYCELFYRLAEPLGIRVEIIPGKSKDRDGNIDPDGHTWIFAVTDKERNEGILIDPTWGAGTVEGSVFTRKEDDMSWFEVSPEWLAFTHFPDNAASQFLPQPLGYEEFLRLPPLHPYLGLYGLDGKEMLEAAKQGRAVLPEFYDSGGEKLLHIMQIPMEGTLRVGETYTFAFTKKAGCKLALFNNKDGVEEKDWQRKGGTYQLSFTPSGGDDLHIGIYDPIGKNYKTAIRYKMARATEADLERLARKRPFAMPEIKRLRNVNPKRMEAIGIDGIRLLGYVRESGMKSLPEFYADGNFTAEDIPLDGRMKVGQPYTFRIRPHEGTEWAIINQGQWFLEWNVDPETGIREITVAPAHAGSLVLAVQKEEGGKYYHCLKYEVAE